MRLWIGGDLVPTESNVKAFLSGDAEALVGQKLWQLLRSADYRIFNLEVPLTDRAAPIEKCGPALIAPAAAVAGYEALGVDLLTLGNNHIMDQGKQGYLSTVEQLDSYGIARVGAGETPEAAAEPYIVELHGKKLGIYACAEHEFSIVDVEKPGANPFDSLESPDHVAELKQQCDYVIVLYHGGKEHYRYPSPGLQKVCRKLVQKGADLVICQHSHCIGCEEKYLHGTIVYGQGNFLFDYRQSEYWQTGLLVGLDENLSVTYLPLCKDGAAVRLAEGAEAEAILEGFHTRSRKIREAGFVESAYKAFACQHRTDYLLAASTLPVSNLVFRLVNKLTGYRWGRWLVNRKYPKHKLLRLRNYLECQAHRELFLKGIEER